MKYLTLALLVLAFAAAEADAGLFQRLRARRSNAGTSCGRTGPATFLINSICSGSSCPIR